MVTMGRNVGDDAAVLPLGTRAEDTPIEIGPTTGEAEFMEIVGRRIAGTR